MQRIAKIFFSCLLSVIFIANVNAASLCSTSEQAELRTLVSNMRGTYAEAERELSPDEYGMPDAIEGTPEEETYKAYEYFLKLNVTNITDKFYVIVSNDVNKDEVRYNYSDTNDGILTIDWHDVSAVANFKIKVYTSSNTGCQDELYRTITIKAPRYNGYSDYYVCENIPDYNLCQKWVTFEDMPEVEFLKRMDNYLNSKDANKGENDEDLSLWDTIKNFVLENKYYFIGGGVVLLISAGVVVAVIVKKQRSSEL